MTAEILKLTSQSTANKGIFKDGLGLVLFQCQIFQNQGMSIIMTCNPLFIFL